jgi:hypothetical protein
VTETPDQLTPGEFEGWARTVELNGTWNPTDPAPSTASGLFQMTEPPPVDTPPVTGEAGELLRVARAQVEGERAELREVIEVIEEAAEFRATDPLLAGSLAEAARTLRRLLRLPREPGDDWNRSGATP